MARSRATTKKAGTDMEVWSVAHMKLGLARLPFAEFIQRRTKNGNKDLGDIANVRLPDGRPLTVEVKNTARLDIAGHLREAEIERLNDGAPAKVVIAKRIGIGETRMGEQLAFMTLDDLIVILGGERPTLGREVSDA